MVLVLIIGKMGQNMLAIDLIIKLVGKALIFGMMEENMWASG